MVSEVSIYDVQPDIQSYKKDTSRKLLADVAHHSVAVQQNSYHTLPAKKALDVAEHQYKKDSSIWLLLMKKMQFILTAINSNMKIEPQAFKLSLKKKYQNLLNIAKTKERQNKVTRRKTCGGPSEELPLSTVEQILSI